MAIDEKVLRANVERWRADGGVCAKEYVRDVELLLAETVVLEERCRVAAHDLKTCVDGADGYK